MVHRLTSISPPTPNFLLADIDECKEGLASCPTLRECVNTVGGFQCNCSAGYKENEETGNCECELGCVGVRV